MISIEIMPRSREGVRHHDKACVRPVAEARDDALDVGGSVHGGGQSARPQGSRCRLERLQVIGEIGRGLRIEHERGAGDARGTMSLSISIHLPLSDDFDVDEARDVAAGTRQAGDESAPDRVGNDDEHDRNRLGLALQRGDDRRGLSDDQIGLQADQLFRKRLHAIDIGRAPPGRSGYCGPPSSQAPEALSEDRSLLRTADRPRRFPSARRSAARARPAAPRGERPRDRCTTQNAEKFPPPHVRPQGSGGSIVSAQTSALIDAMGGAEDILSIVADVNRWSTPCRS